MDKLSLENKSTLMMRLGQLKAERATWYPSWQELSMYLLPRNGRYFRQDHNKGWKREQSIYDNTASRALEVLSAGLMSGLTSPARPWFRLATSDPDLNQSNAVRIWMAHCTRLMLDIFARSNTYRALHDIYREIVTFGTAVNILGQDYDMVIYHYPVTTGEYCLAQDYQGKVNTIYREFEKPVATLVSEFGYENCSTAVRNLYDRGSLDQWIPIIHGIEPRKDRDPSKKDALNMAYKSVYFEIGADETKPLRVSGYETFPGLAPRWAVAGGDIYGNGPGIQCIGDIKQLQQEQLRKSQAIDYMTNPPLQVPSQLKNREVDRLPGGVTYYDTNSQSPGIKTMFDVALDINALGSDIMDVRQRINSSFYVDLFLMIANDQRSGVTATEIAQKQEEKMLMLGPVLERLHNELLDPLITYTFDKMLKGGLLPPPPPELQGQNLNVELISILAQAQRAVATNGIDRFVSSLGAIAQFKPDVLDKFDADQWADIYSDMLGVDPELITADEKVALIRKQRAQAQAQATQMQGAQMAADTAQKLGNTPVNNGNGTALDAINQFSGY